jgi:hypothetical protein
LKRICDQEGMPTRATVFSWMNKQPEFMNNYTRAKQEAADAYAEDIEDIAHEVRSGKLDPNAGRVAGDLLKWTSSKLKPKKYGDKLDVTSGNEKITPMFGGLSVIQANNGNPQDIQPDKTD